MRQTPEPAQRKRAGPTLHRDFSLQISTGDGWAQYITRPLVGNTLHSLLGDSDSARNSTATVAMDGARRLAASVSASSAADEAILMRRPVRPPTPPVFWGLSFANLNPFRGFVYH